MTVHTFYRLAIWFPMLLPTIAVMLFHGLGYRPEAHVARKLMQLLLMIFLYGGTAYVPLALFGTFWVGHRPEHVIRRMAVRAPLLMVGPFAMISLFLFVMSRSMEVAIAYGFLGSIMSLWVGYTCVGVVFGCRVLLATAGLLPAVDDNV